jgi:hypothetical protein
LMQPLEHAHGFQVNKIARTKPSINSCAMLDTLGA